MRSTRCSSCSCPLPGARTDALRCAQRARLKVSSTFSKVVESRGKASGRAPQSAEPPDAYLRSGRGSEGETLSRGFPLFLCVCTCAPLRMALDASSCCPSTPFLLSCQKKRRRAVKEKRLALIFTIAGRTRRWQCLPVVSASRDAPFAPGEGEVGACLAVDVRGTLRRGRTCRPDGEGNCLRQVQHNVRPAIKKIRTKGRFSLGQTPFLLARAKEMGCLAAGPYATAHT